VLEAIFIIFGTKLLYFVKHQPYKNHPPHLFCFIALPCEVTLPLNFTFFAIQKSTPSKNKEIFKHETK